MGIAMICNKFYHFFTSLVQITKPFELRLFVFDDIMHQKVHCVNQTPRPKYFGVFILNNCSRCLTVSSIISDDLDDIVYGPILSIVASNGSAMLMSVLNLSE